MNWFILIWYRFTFWVICRVLPRLQGKTMYKSEIRIAVLPAKPGWVIPIIYQTYQKK